MLPLRNAGRFFNKAITQPGYALKVAVKRFKAYQAYNSAGGRSGSPEAITFFLTHRCNLQCQMCGQWGEGGVTKKQSSQYIGEELSREELIAAIDEVSKFKPNITLFGGEPLLYPHCVEIIKHIKQKGMHCLMITNGSLLEQNAEAIVANGLDELNVSLDAGSQLHDQIRGMPGLFERIMRGLKLVNHFKAVKKTKKPLINLQCTINKQNYGYLEQLLGVAGEIKANSLTFHNLIFLSGEIIEKQKAYDEKLGCQSLDWQGFVFEPQMDPRIIHEKKEKILSKKHGFSVDFYPNFSCSSLMDYYKKPDYLPVGYSGRCVSPWIAAYIFPDGEVRPCLNFSYSYGNIKNNKFKEIWNSEKAIKYRQVLKENKIFPVCVRCTELYRY